jgi:hypothetical protein
MRPDVYGRISNPNSIRQALAFHVSRSLAASQDARPSCVEAARGGTWGQGACQQAPAACVLLLLHADHMGNPRPTACCRADRPVLSATALCGHRMHAAARCACSSQVGMQQPGVPAERAKWVRGDSARLARCRASTSAARCPRRLPSRSRRGAAARWRGAAAARLPHPAARRAGAPRHDIPPGLRTWERRLARALRRVPAQRWMQGRGSSSAAHSAPAASRVNCRA